jgi:flavin reductase (DIM6/NTAB) family NADH-FMN oxidoreductase RutF
MSEQQGGNEVARALCRVPAGMYIVTAAFDGVQAGVLVQWVQQVGAQPPIVSVAFPKGVRIIPLIRDSRAFAISILSAENRYLTRRFKTEFFGDEDLACVGVETLVTGSPLLTRAAACLDCELVRHLDLEPEADLYIGEVKAARLNRPEAKTLVFLGEDAHEIG